VEKSDAYLVKRSQEGDIRSFELLVVKYQKRIFNVIFRIVKDSVAVEDLAQEAFLNAFKAIKGFKGGSSFYTWLYRIAANVSINYLSKNKKATFIDEEHLERASVTESAPGREISPERHTLNRESANAISEAIETLPDDIKKAVMLREYEGLSYEEIAEIMDCPIGTVRSRIFRGRNILKGLLKEYL